MRRIGGNSVLLAGNSGGKGTWNRLLWLMAAAVIVGSLAQGSRVEAEECYERSEIGRADAALHVTASHGSIGEKSP